jgi:hypothetical protein
VDDQGCEKLGEFPVDIPKPSQAPKIWYLRDLYYQYMAMWYAYHIVINKC